MSLRRKVLVSLLVTVVPLAVLTVAAYLVARDGLVDQARDQVAQEARLRALEVDRRLDIAVAELDGIAGWVDLSRETEATLTSSSGQTEGLDASLAAVSTWWPQFSGFVIVDGQGSVVASHGSPDVDFSTWPQLAPETAELGPDVVWLSAPVVGTTARVQTAVARSFIIVDEPVISTAEAPGSSVVSAIAVVDRLDLDIVAARSRADVLAPLGPLRWAMFAAAGATLILVGACALWFWRRVSSRLSRLTALTEAMGDGDWTARVDDNADDEVGRLSAALDRLAENVENDQNQRRQIQDQLAHQALHDPLTGLANRAKFLDRLRDALARSSRSGAPVAVLFCDLDNLKTINDEMGHQAGDDLLTSIAQRMSASIRPSDTVARFGGDEFVVLCAEMAAAHDATVVADRLLAALAEPFEIQGETVNSSASIGIAVGSGATSSPDDLVTDADAAMYVAKRGGKAKYVVHDGEVDERAARRDRLRRDAARALEHRELRLEFQPMLELETGSLLGVEALLRWDHPDKGVLTPSQALRAFADASMTSDLDAWVIDNAAAHIDHWNASVSGGVARVRVAVNVTLASLRGDELSPLIEKVVAEHQIDPSQLMIEVSERDVGSDPVAVVAMLDRLRALGVGLVLDDFGTAHTSLDRLRRLGVDLIKIDHALIEAIGTPDGDAAISSIVAVGASLGNDVVAEGVEELEQVPELLLQGCRYAQGHLFCGPLDDLAVLPWLQRSQHPTEARR